MKNFRAMYQVKATGQKKITKFADTVQTEEDARKAFKIRFGDACEIIAIVDMNSED